MRLMRRPRPPLMTCAPVGLTTLAAEPAARLRVSYGDAARPLPRLTTFSAGVIAAAVTPSHTLPEALQRRASVRRDVGSCGELGSVGSLLSQDCAGRLRPCSLLPRQKVREGRRRIVGRADWTREGGSSVVTPTGSDAGARRVAQAAHQTLVRPKVRISGAWHAVQRELGHQTRNLKLRARRAGRENTESQSPLRISHHEPTTLRFRVSQNVLR